MVHEDLLKGKFVSMPSMPFTLYTFTSYTYLYKKDASPTHVGGPGLIFFIVQLGATGPPKYTFSNAKL